MVLDSQIAMTIQPPHKYNDDEGNRVVERIPSSVFFCNTDKELVVSDDDFDDDSYSSFETMDEIVIPDFESSSGVGLPRQHQSMQSLHGYLEEWEQKQQILPNSDQGARGTLGGSGHLRRRYRSIQKKSVSPLSVRPIPVALEHWHDKQNTLSNTDQGSQWLEAGSGLLLRRGGSIHQKRENQGPGLQRRCLSTNSPIKACRWASNGKLNEFDGNKSSDSIPKLPGARRHIDLPVKAMKNSSWGDTIASPTKAADLSRFFNFSSQSPKKQIDCIGTSETTPTTLAKAMMMSPRFALDRIPTKTMQDRLQTSISLTNSISCTSFHDSISSEIDSPPRKPRRNQSRMNS
jgi:hypothetical protein